MYEVFLYYDLCFTELYNSIKMSVMILPENKKHRLNVILDIYK